MPLPAALSRLRGVLRWTRSSAAAVGDPFTRFAWNRVRGTRPPIPPLALRTRVGLDGKDPSRFLAQGHAHVLELGSALALTGRSWTDFAAICDFGCGVGRQTRWLPAIAARAAWTGVDIDPASIAWLSKNIERGRFVTTGPQPPTSLDSGSCDLVYSVSVFTHLPEAAQIAWLQELARIVAPGGVLLLTTHGPHALGLHRSAPNPTTAALPTTEELEAEGLCFRPYPAVFAAAHGGNYGMTYHSHTYIRDTWSEYLTVEHIVRAGIDDHQDIVVLSRALGVAPMLDSN